MSENTIRQVNEEFGVSLIGLRTLTFAGKDVVLRPYPEQTLRKRSRAMFSLVARSYWLGRQAEIGIPFRLKEVI